MCNKYQNPLINRYASEQMLKIFSDQNKFTTWRKLWITLAECQKELGLNIDSKQIEQMKRFEDKINYDVAREREHEVRHDVMAHVYAYGKQCPEAKPIIHLGATSCFVGDNTDLIIFKQALLLIRKKLINCINSLSKFAIKYYDMPTLGFTHFQPAQLTTVGKRACLWIQDLLIDFEQIENILDNMKLRGAKGTTGTQASFLTLFDGDHEKVKKLDNMIAERLGFKSTFPVTGQTYPRKIDSIILNALSGIAQSCYKFSNDLRLLQNLKEIEEPFEDKQIGSSAMAYKRNPMRSERMSSLARYVIVTALNTAITSSTQWFERTLDDSANRRITIPESFLAVDSILNIYLNITQGMVVYPKVIQKHINQELPFMATEYILMEAVKKGGDRQELHEKIRKYSMQASKMVKQFGKQNDLIERIINDKDFNLSASDINSILDAKNFVGRAPEQVKEFIQQFVKPILEKNKHLLDLKIELKV